MGSELRAALVLFTLVALGLVTVPARAEPSASDRETARALMKEGDGFLREKDPARALRAYQAAHGIMDVPSTGMAVVRALTQIGRLVEARDVALQVIRIPVAAHEAAPLKQARAEAAEAARSLEPRIAGLVVKAPGAQIVIDGVSMPESAAGLVRKLDPGPHEVVVSAPGYKDAKLPLTLAEGETREISPELERIAEEPAKPPLPAPTPRPKEPATVARAAPVATHERATTTADLLLIGGASTAVVGVAVGSVAGIMAINRSAELRDACPSAGCPPSRQADYDSAHRLATVSNVAFVVGAIGLGVGAYGYYLLRSDSGKPSSNTAVWPVAGLGRAGLAGRF